MSNSPRQYTILCVEDDDDIRELVEIALKLDRGLKVHACASGEQALAVLPQVNPDLVLLDVMMPGLDGVQTVARMRHDVRYKYVPVVFMTAKALPQELASFRAFGASVISKPFDPMKLSGELRKILEARR